MRYGNFSKIISIVIGFLVILSIGGVYATWRYSQGVCIDSYENLKIDVFPWEGSSILPKDDQIGENHKTLIENILNGTTTDANGNIIELGLNSPDSYINTEIESRSNGSWWATSDTLGSMDYWESAEIDNYFNTSTENLSFVLYFPDGVADTYYLFTTGVDLEYNGSPNIEYGENVYPIYRTVLSKNTEGVWKAIETKLGYAQSAWYDNRITGGFLQTPSFDPSSWTEGELGHTPDTAIWTYRGQSTTAYPADATSPVYYKIQPESATTYTVYTTNPSAQIFVLDENQNEVDVTDGSQGGNTITFTAKANTLYYFKLVGDISVSFSIT